MSGRRGAAERALELLRKALEAADSLRRGEDGRESLHGFRVNLRRLLGHLKSFRGICPSPKRLRRELRRIFKSTGPIRDAQIRELWLERYARRASSRARAGVLIQACRAGGGAALPRGFWSRLDGPARRLRRALEAAARGRGADHEAFREAAGRRAGKDFRRLGRAIERLKEKERPKDLHRARIAVKKLRYVLEPFEDGMGGYPSQKQLTRLQTLLGDAHDRDVLAGYLRGLAKKTPRAARPAAEALAELDAEKRALLSLARREWVKPVFKGPDRI